MQTYAVNSGDTLYGISKQFGVSIDKIKESNNLISNTLAVGQILKIPTEETTAIYIVNSGDTLYSIARKYNITPEKLIVLNNLKSNTINPGQEIRIPIGEDAPDSTIEYNVKKGDSLYSIAKKYDTTVDILLKLNSLKTSNLSIGQVLKIPSEEEKPLYGYEAYTVKSGDSLYKIANKYGMTVDELMELNNLKSTNLSIGQVLRVRQEEVDNIPSNLTECYSSDYTEPTYEVYTVKKGDSLYIIANKFNTTVDTIKVLNKLTSNNLSIGQVLKIKEVI